MVYLCAISNVSSGGCSEDCSFCTQSAKVNANIDIFRKKSVKEVVNEAKMARENRAVGFCLVTSGRGMNDEKLEYISLLATAIKKEEPELNLIACNGIATKDELKELKKHGIGSYNHNLESSKSYYQKVCSTHSWEDRYETCLSVKEVGLKLCSGGIFGMGESREDREELVSSLVSLSPDTIAVNFFHPNSALEIKSNKMSKEEALFMIRYVKSRLPSSRVMVAGGREQMFGENFGKIFEFGADAIVIGDYLTTSGQEPSRDIVTIKSLGLEIAESCNG